MTTSSITSFNLNLNELVEEAYERAGLEMRSGYDLRTARRSLNLLTIEWANRGINLWTIEQGQILMNTGQAIYPIPEDTIDLLDHVVRTNNGATNNQIDINISRISESTYSTIPNKNAYGRPIQVWINRQNATTNNLFTTTLNGSINSSIDTINLVSAQNMPAAGFINIGSETIAYQNVVGNQLQNCFRGQNGTTAASHSSGAEVTVTRLPCVNVWPTPNAPGNQYTFVYWRMRRMQNAGNGATTQDIPFRFLPCMVAGLAYYISMKKPEVPESRIMMLKADYEQQFQLAADEDREKAPARYVPRVMFY